MSYWSEWSVSIPPAPSAAPTSVSVSEVTSSSITVQWGAVDCIHRNGDISGYSVRYGVQGSAVVDRSVEMVSGGDITQTTISGLTPSTAYSIEVAAVNSAGIGVYGERICSQGTYDILWSTVHRETCTVIYTCTWEADSCMPLDLKKWMYVYLWFLPCNCMPRVMLIILPLFPGF